jgi:2-dehydro-3-deoxygluconokinase
MTARRVRWQRDGACRIAAVGECMIEISRDRDGRLREGMGGDSLNTALYLARLLRPGDETVHYVTGLGRDPFSRAMMDAWHAEGIGTDLIRIDRRRLPGLYYIVTDAGGERGFHYWRGESAARSMMSAKFAELLRERLAGFRLVYLTGVSLAILPPAGRRRLLALLERLRARGVAIAFDPNYRARLWRSDGEAAKWHGEIHRLADVVLCSLDDERAVSGDADASAVCARLAGSGVGEVVVRDGPGPCVAAAEGAIHRFGAVEPVPVVDTTAAGDSFNAAYLALRLRGADVGRAVAAGRRLATEVIRHPGAIIAREHTPALAVIDP